MAITLTDRAAQHVQNYLAKRGKGVGVRFGVRTTGCSCMAYKLEFVDSASAEDQAFESHGVKVFVDPNSREVFAYQPQIVPANRTAVPLP